MRECARRHGVSPNTVVAAYDQLLAQGLVEARRNRGFFVREPRPRHARSRRMRQPRQRKHAAGARPLPIERHRADPRHVPATAAAQADARPGHAAGRVARPAAAAPRALRRPTEPARSPRFRCSTATRPATRGCASALAHKLADLGVAAAPEQIVTTVGATHALDVVSRTLLRAGDSVLVDEPGWAVEYARLTRARHARAAGAARRRRARPGGDAR